MEAMRLKGSGKPGVAGVDGYEELIGIPYYDDPTLRRTKSQEIR